MSLEAAISELNTNIVALIAAVKAAGTPTVNAKAESQVKTTEKSTTTSKPAETKTEKPAEKPVETKGEDKAVTYDDVKAAILKLATEKGRDQATAILQRYGVAKAPDLTPEQWPDVLKDTNAAIAGTYNPEAAEDLA